MYDYQTERKELFTESGVETLTIIRDNVRRLLAEAGAFTADKVMSKCTGSTWTMLAAIDYLVEKGEIRRVTQSSSTWGQHQVFTK